MPSLFTLPPKKLTWLITGATSGFGLSLARIVQAAGHTVIATSRNPSRTPDLVSEIESKGGKLLALDLAHADGGKFIEELEQSEIQIDVLVNNAGFCTFGIVKTATEEELRAQMDTMYFGPLRLIRGVLPFMRKRRFGVIANISTGAALDGNPSMGPYAGAKAGLDGLTKVLAKEVAPFNIRAMTVILGTFNTNFGSAASFGDIPLPSDYKGSFAETMIAAISSGQVPANGDKDKATKALYEIVMGEGLGVGRESETFVFLGPDMSARVKTLQDSLGRSLGVFSNVANGVAANP